MFGRANWKWIGSHRDLEMRKLIVMLLVIGPSLLAQAQKVEPTWLFRPVATLREHPIDLTTSSCHYTPIFGEADVESRLPQSFARFGKLMIDARGSCKNVAYPRQEELIFTLDGSGVLHHAGESHPLAQNDFTYVPPTVPHSLSNPSDQSLKVVVASVRVPADTQILPPAKLEVANLSELKEQVVSGHPSSVLYKLMIGPRTAARDRINATYTVADFFLMDFAPGGTNFPHHHETAEEIYLVLDGEGQIVAGGGMDGVEGLHPAKAGDAYFFRQNCTVGFYNQKTPGAKAHILAVRAFIPIPKNPE
jgi:mannose-6-phosphate isomerase-like protein (cupin superfamily)